MKQTSWTPFSSQKGNCSTYKTWYLQVPFCDEKSVQLVELHLSEVTSYKIHVIIDKSYQSKKWTKTVNSTSFIKNDFISS